MILLLQSGLRALLLGACVWGLLRLLRLRDARSETAAWTLVLAASLAMPLLTPLLEGLIPGAPLPQAPLPVRGFAALPRTGFDWPALFWSAYALGAALMLGRLAAGLVLSLRLYRRTVPLAGAPCLRIGDAVRGPMVFGRAILLPGDWHDWPEAKQAAVLAHEQRHRARGDFFLQLAANLYRACFWFSPFAWWLQRKLCALGERDSDAAAVRRMGDPAGYAELLVEAACRAQGLPALVAMAKGPDIAWRVEHILAAEPERTPGAARQSLAAAILLAASVGVAGAHAARAADMPALIALPAAAVQTTMTPVAASQPVETITMPRHRRIAMPPPAPQNVSYNPRALLEAPVAAARPAPMLTGR